MSRRVLVAAGFAGSLVACNAIFGLDELRYEPRPAPIYVDDEDASDAADADAAAPADAAASDAGPGNDAADTDDAASDGASARDAEEDAG